MVLPVQAQAGVGGDADAELAFAIGSVESDVAWVFPPRLESALSRSPGLDTRTTGLAVGVFMRTEVQRVGDPLYGHIRRLAALVNADVVLIPVQLAPGPADEGEEATLEAAASTSLGFELVGGPLAARFEEGLFGGVEFVAVAVGPSGSGREFGALV
jgi:hypothetical protein